MLLEALIEVALILILVGGGVYGYRKGLFKLVARPLRVILCLALAFSLCGSVGDELISPLIAPAVKNYLLELLEQQRIGVDTTIDNLPTVLKILIGLLALGGTSDIEWTVDKLVDLLAAPFSSLVSRIIAFVILVALAMLILKLTIIAIESLLDAGVLGKINSILGVILSGCISFLLAWAFVSVVDYLFHLEMLRDSARLEGFVGGPIYRLLREASPIWLLLSF